MPLMPFRRPFPASPCSRVPASSRLLRLFLAPCLLVSLSPCLLAAAQPWPELSDAQQQQAITQLKSFAQDARDQLNINLSAFETKYFIFCSDLSPGEAQRWASLLDRMYDRLSEMFAVPSGKNIWRGKALIFVFSKNADYLRYEKQIMHTDPGGTAGMCHSSSNGNVRIAFHRQEDQLEFAHILVHESVHGFIHRYRTPVPIPSWANEGLAETIATDLVPQNGRKDAVKGMAVHNLNTHNKRLGDFFSADHIEDWQYPVAQMLTTMMIEAGKKNYVDFINGVKDGMSVDDALAEKFKAPKPRLVQVFGNYLGVQGLKWEGTKARGHEGEGAARHEDEGGGFANGSGHRRTLPDISRHFFSVRRVRLSDYCSLPRASSPL
jgi:hypothetical protein